MPVRTIFFLMLLFLGGSAYAQPTQQEQRLVDQLNQSRAQAGLPPLKVDGRLTQAAREHSQSMADARTLTHVLPGEPTVADRLAATGLHFNRSGENVGYHTDFNGLHSGWMHSPPHRANILNPDFTLVGIGVVRGADGVYWATQDFAHGTVARTGDQAEDLAAQQIDALRKSSGLSPMRRLNSPDMQPLACSMGRAGQVDPSKVLALPGVHYAVTYNNSNPAELPASAKNAVRKPAVTRYAVGACAISDQANPGGTYYVVLAFY